jgi:hypothetical protein
MNFKEGKGAGWHMPVIPELGKLRQQDFRVQGQPKLYNETCLKKERKTKKPTIS